MRAVLVNGYHIIKYPSPYQRFSYFKHITAGPLRENEDGMGRAEVNEFLRHGICQLFPIQTPARVDFLQAANFKFGVQINYKWPVSFCRQSF